MLWGALWAYVGLPWRSFRLQPSFQNVEIVPFVDGSVRTQTLNLLAFVPLGIIASRLGWNPRTVALAGFCVSALTELLQFFSTRRHPSTTDLILNTAGTVIGITLATYFARLPGRAPGESEA